MILFSIAFTTHDDGDDYDVLDKSLGVYDVVKDVTEGAEYDRVNDTTEDVSMTLQ